MSKKNSVSLRLSGLPAKDPNARCDGCGAIGTVGRAHRTVNDVIDEMYVYCINCWPENYTRLESRWREEARIANESWTDGNSEPPPSVSWGFESQTWDVVLRGVEALNRMQDTSDPPSREQLALIAAGIVKRADEIEGPMPLAVEAFLREHSGPV